MKSTTRQPAALTTLLALTPLLLLGCSAGTDPDPGGSEGKGSSAQAPDGAPEPVEGLGGIVVGGRPVTGSKPSGDARVPYQRTYTDGALYAAVTGYRSMAYGRAGIEAVYDEVLTAGAGGDGGRSGHVVTSISPAVQKAAADALDGREGAAVAIDAGSGRILALVSSPSYDPATFSGFAGPDQAAWEKLTKDESKPLFNRPLREAVAPDETFNLVVAAAALEKGLYRTVDESTRGTLPYTLPGTVTEVTGGSPSCARASIRTALRHACDNVFASMAAELGQAGLASTAASFGFNDDALGVPVRVAESTYPTGDVSGAEVALTGIGQGQVRATSLQMADVMAVIANGGARVVPSAVDKIVLGDGTVQKPKKGGAQRVIGQDTADQLRSALESATTGAGGAGKTGWVAPTASYGAGATAWFVSYARGKDGRPVAFAVWVKDPGNGRPGDARSAVGVVEQMRKAIS